MYTYKITVDRVVDGDTIDANIDLGFDVSVKKELDLWVLMPQNLEQETQKKKLKD